MCVCVCSTGNFANFSPVMGHVELSKFLYVKVLHLAKTCLHTQISLPLELDCCPLVVKTQNSPYVVQSHILHIFTRGIFVANELLQMLCIIKAKEVTYKLLSTLASQFGQNFKTSEQYHIEDKNRNVYHVISFKLRKGKIQCKAKSKKIVAQYTYIANVMNCASISYCVTNN